MSATGSGSGEPMIEASGLSKYYGPFVAVHDISFVIPQGQVVAFLGPNGAGKTSLIKLMTGQLKPNQGEIRVLDQPVWNNTELTRRVGYCPDIELAYQFMSGFTFLSFFATMSGYDETEGEARSLQVLETVGMGAAKDRPSTRL